MRNAQNVKNTMIDVLLSMIAPHPCCSCGELGGVLCENCKYDIVDEPFLLCVACGKNVAATGVCINCSVPYARAWCGGVREGKLQRLVGLYKFQNAYAARTDIADVLDARIDMLPSHTVVVPVPTIPSHVRMRGYDHMLEVAKLFANRRGLKMETVLVRSGISKQRGANSAARDAQAKRAFAVNGTVDFVPHLLLDDVVTTGATVRYASKALMDAGASEVWLGIVCRQSID